MQLSHNILELCLQMTITGIYFCLLSLPEAQKYLHLRDQISYTNSKSEKVRERKNAIKYSVSEVDLLCFVIMQFFTVHSLKNKSLPAHIFKWFYWFWDVCVCVFMVFIKRIALSYLQKRNDQREVCSMLPLLLSTPLIPQVRSLSPRPREKEEIGLLFSSSVSNGWKTLLLELNH